MKWTRTPGSPIPALRSAPPLTRGVSHDLDREGNAGLESPRPGVPAGKRSGPIVAVMTRILLISGSTHEQSVHTAALRTATKLAPADIIATLYDGLRHLPAYLPGES